MRLQLDAPVSGNVGLTSAPADGASAAGISGSTSSSRDSRTSPDTAFISGTSSVLAQVASDRAARIDQITASVQAGSYQISSAAISRAVVGEALA